MLEDLGNLGDFLGGIAVIATLLYVAVQIRQNTRQITQNSETMRLSFENEIRRELNAFRLSIAGDETLFCICFWDPFLLPSDQQNPSRIHNCHHFLHIGLFRKSLKKDPKKPPNWDLFSAIIGARSLLKNYIKKVLPKWSNQAPKWMPFLAFCVTLFR